MFNFNFNYFLFVILKILNNHDLVINIKVNENIHHHSIFKFILKIFHMLILFNLIMVKY